MDCKSAFDLSGRVALVTGGAGMLGTRHCEALAEFGANVVVVDIKEAAAQASAEQLSSQYGTTCLGLEADITDPDSVQGLVDRVDREFGKIDVLVNNAAMTVEYGRSIDDRYFAPFESYPLALWEASLKTNLTGTFLVTQAVGKIMCREGKGVVINIASDLSVIAPDHRIYEDETFNTPVHYSVCKTGLVGLTRYLATYWATKNIRVNAVSPAGVFDGHDQRFVDKLSSRIPLGRMADKDEYKATIVYLASDASSFMTGTNLVIDGGRSSW